MSIGSIVQTIQSQSPYIYQPATTSTASPADPFTLASGASASASGSGSATGSNPMQALASDLQSALLSLQSLNGAGTPAATTQLASVTSTSAAPAAATAGNPFQSLSSDLQSALMNLQSVDPNGSGATQQTGGATHAHRGHHRHGGGEAGGMADPAGGVQADAPALPGTTQPATTTA